MAKRKPKVVAAPVAASVRLRLSQLAAEDAVIATAASAFASMLTRAGVTRTGYARALGVPESHVAKFLTGRNVTLRTLAKYAHALKCRVRIRFEPEAEKKR